MDETTSKNLLPILIALVIGGVIGYSLKGGLPQPQKETMKVETREAAKPESKEAKIENAISAATESISKEATVFDWPQKEGDKMAELKKGTNEWTCLPDYPASPGNDPICVDKVAMQWFGAYMTKKKPAITQAGIAYMLQGGSDPSNTDPFAAEPAEGEDWLSAPPHIMVFPAGDLDPEVYGTDPKSGKPWIMWSGTPYEHLMIPVR